MIRLLAASLLWAGLVVATPGQAAPPQADAASRAPSGTRSDGPAWNELPAGQQSALAPLKGQWASMDAVRKEKWIAVAQRFPALPAAEQRRVQARMAEWANMSAAERGRARQNFQELRTLPQADRQALWEAYRSLPDERKRELAQRSKPRPKTAEAPPPEAGKRAVAVNPPPVPTKPVSPTVVQAKPGATTKLVSKDPSPPAHHRPGLPKITATEGFVNPTTLLPSRGPQGAATLPLAAPAASAAQ